MNTENSVGRNLLSLPMADEKVVTPKAKAERAKVLTLEPGSPADLAGVQLGDVITHVNGQPVLDIVDFAFLSAGESVSLDMLRGADTLHFEIAKGYDDDLGIEFGDDLFDRVHICKNKCVFCFLYQQPKGLRPSLYIKDDDYRLSFLHGNYLTLTNMGEAEFQRVIDQKLSPLFVSVHATDPEVRGRMLGRKGPEPILPRLEMLADAKIQIHGQVVLCPGYNDGAQLEQTVRELAATASRITRHLRRRFVGRRCPRRPNPVPGPAGRSDNVQPGVFPPRLWRRQKHGGRSTAGSSARTSSFSA